MKGKVIITKPIFFLNPEVPNGKPTTPLLNKEISSSSYLSSPSTYNLNKIFLSPVSHNSTKENKTHHNESEVQQFKREIREVGSQISICLLHLYPI